MAPKACVGLAAPKDVLPNGDELLPKAFEGDAPNDGDTELPAPNAGVADPLPNAGADDAPNAGRGEGTPKAVGLVLPPKGEACVAPNGDVVDVAPCPNIGLAAPNVLVCCCCCCWPKAI